MFHYTACGLSNIWLENGYTITKTHDGEVFHIEHIKALHEAIGRDLVASPALLTGSEFRFLRGEMRMSRAILAELLGYSSEAIKKWEADENPISKPVDAILRSLYLQFCSEESDVGALVRRINQLEKQEQPARCFKETSLGWIKDCA